VGKKYEPSTWKGNRSPAGEPRIFGKDCSEKVVPSKLEAS